MPTGIEEDRAARGRLSARPVIPHPGGMAATGVPAGPGVHQLGLGGGRRDGLLAVPPGVPGAAPAPLIVMLHGAGGDARGTLPLIKATAEAAGALVLLPESRGRTWDVILGGYGPDVAFTDAALRQVFAAWAVDPARIAVAGFSDGASYALSLGLANGDLFTHVLAFSPGFAAPAETVGRPRLYVSHGVADEVLPIDTCSRRLVPRLERKGYTVRYREFDGGHWVPDWIAREAVAMLTES